MLKSKNNKAGYKYVSSCPAISIKHLMNKINIRSYVWRKNRNRDQNVINRTGLPDAGESDALHVWRSTAVVRDHVLSVIK